MESTYGGRDRAPMEQTVERFKQVIERAARDHERVIIPAFAVGRTQVILFYLAEAVREGRLPRDFPIYLDSPMADRATQAVIDHPELYDEEAAELRKRRQVRADLRGLRITESVADSMALNESDHACIIISASGMCEGGRIVHHLKHNLWRPNANVLLVGYMAEGTLGRQLAEAAARVEIFGEEVVVRAQIHRLDGFSAHAGHSELLDWLSEVAPSKPRIVLTHGEDEARAALGAAIAERYGIVVDRPRLDDVIALE
jgi:metallo-beta-lactamase family protein